MKNAKPELNMAPKMLGNLGPAKSIFCLARTTLWCQWRFLPDFPECKKSFYWKSSNIIVERSLLCFPSTQGSSSCATHTRICDMLAWPLLNLQFRVICTAASEFRRNIRFHKTKTVITIINELNVQTLFMISNILANEHAPTNRPTRHP